MPQPRISRRASKAWDRLRQWYGARLVEQYGDVPPPDWCDVFDRTDDERLEDALLTVRRDSPIHPPTLGQIEVAVPKRQASGAPSKPQQLADLMMQKHGREMCVHQIATTWNYFGPMREFQFAGIKPPVFVSHPDPHGVQVPACARCSLPSRRVLLDEAVSEGVAA